MTIPLVFTFLAVASLSWSAFEKAQLITIASRAASLAALADVDDQDAIDFAKTQARSWLGIEVSVEITKDRFAHLTLSYKGKEVTVDALCELSPCRG